MKHFKFFIAPFFITLFFCSRCDFKKNKTSVVTTLDRIIKPKYASNFFISKNPNKQYFSLHIIAPSKQNDTFSYRLISKKKDDRLKISKAQITLSTPISRFIASSTTDIPFIEALENEKSLVGFTETKYISSKKTRQLINKNKIKNVGNVSQLNSEVILEILPELFISSSPVEQNKNLTFLKRNNINTLLNTSWLEQHPLGRAEWIKVFGYLFEKEKKADSIFNKIEANYNNLKKIARETQTLPTVLSGNLYKDVWYTPAGNSFEAKLIADANGDYLWKNSKGTGSLSLSIETILDKGQTTDIWLGGGMFSTIKDLTTFEKKYALFKATKTKNTYTKDLTQGETGGLLYFETGVLRPDWILEDLIQIFHPNSAFKKPFHYYKKLK